MLTLVSVSSTKEKTTKDDIVVEMKSNTKNEEAVLLKAVNGDKTGPNEQVSWGGDTGKEGFEACRVHCRHAHKPVLQVPELKCVFYLICNIFGGNSSRVWINN